MASVNSNVMNIYVGLSQQMVLIAKSIEETVNNMPSIWINTNYNYMEIIR